MSETRHQSETRRRPLNLVDNRVPCPQCGEKSDLMDEAGGEWDWVCPVCHYAFKTPPIAETDPKKTKTVDVRFGISSSVDAQHGPLVHLRFAIEGEDGLSLPLSPLQARSLGVELLGASETADCMKAFVDVLTSANGEPDTEADRLPPSTIRKVLRAMSIARNKHQQEAA